MLAADLVFQGIFDQLLKRASRKISPTLIECILVDSDSPDYFFGCFHAVQCAVSDELVAIVCLLLSPL